MGESTKISWTNSTFCPWWGCFKVSAECKNCYANAFAKRTGHDVWGPAARRRFFGEKHWAEPLKWNRKALESGQPHRVFCASMADVFEALPPGHPDSERMAAERSRLWRLIDATPSLTWLLLTKRPENIKHCFPWAQASDGTPLFAPPKNVWLGTSVGVQETRWRIDALRRIPATVHFISAEPQLEDLGELDLAGIEWLISGGESGPGARPFDLAWALSLQRQCAASGTAFFFKQAGARPFCGDSFQKSERGPWKVTGKGDVMTEWPEVLRVQQFPEVTRG